MQTHELKRKNPNAKKVKVGRGGKRGKTSGRGHKGQKSRSGRKLRPEMRDIIKKIPKKRGHGKNRSKSYNSGNIKPQTTNLSDIEKAFNENEIVSVEALISKKLVNKKGNKKPKVKILGNGELNKKLNFKGVLVSSVTEEKVKKAGGSIK
jgi:large subunit ribosomal protein L15